MHNNYKKCRPVNSIGIAQDCESVDKGFERTARDKPFMSQYMLDKVPCLVQMFITADKCDNTASRLKHKEARTCGPRMQVANESRNIKHSE